MEFHEGQWQVQSISYVTPYVVVLSNFQLRHHLYADARWHAIFRQNFATAIGFLSTWVGRLHCSHPGLVSGSVTTTQHGQDRINLVRLGTSSAENSARKVIHPGMWHPSQSFQLCQESRNLGVSHKQKVS